MSHKKSYLVVGDIHGCYQEANALIEAVHQDEQLIFLGDYIDRGPQSKEVLAYVQEKVAAGAIALKGNHEDLFMQFMDKPDYNASLYLPQGGYQTFVSYGYKMMEPSPLAKAFKTNFPKDYDFIANLPLYHETAEFIFVHAGVSPFVDDWKETSDADFMWIREWFHHSPTTTDKTVVFGHTPTIYLHSDKSSAVWQSKDGSKIGIDGGMVFGNRLHALKIIEDGTNTEVINYSINKELKIEENRLR